MWWKEIWGSHGGRIAGVAFGFILGIIYLISGLWDMLFFALLVFIGYTLGRRKDEGRSGSPAWRELLARLSAGWRPFK